MQQRATEDRREKNIKVTENSRKNFRRQEDQEELRSYYIVLFIISSIIVFFGIMSYLNS